MMNKDWFEWYGEQKSKQTRWAMFRDRYLCPCCYMPTLTERRGDDICPICFWEDDGQDTDDEKIVRGGPNKDYSLREARDNFKKFMTMYRKEDTKYFEREQKRIAEIMNLYNAFTRAIITNTENDWNEAINLQEQIP